MSDEGKGPGASADTCALAEVAFQLTVPRSTPCDLSRRRSNALRGVLLGFVLALVAVALGLGRQGRRRASSVDELLQGRREELVALTGQNSVAQLQQSVTRVEGALMSQLTSVLKSRALIKAQQAKVKKELQLAENIQKLQHQGIDRGSSATAAALDVLQDEEAEQARVSAASKRSPSAHAVAQDRASHARASLKGALGDLMVKGSKLPAQFAERDVRTLKGALADLDLYERSIDAKAQGLQGLVHHQDVKASHVQHVMSHLKMKPWMVKLFSGAAESQSVDDKAARSERRLVSKFLSAAERVQSRTDKGGGEQKRAHAPAPAQKQSAHRAGQADQEVQAGSGAGKKRRGDVDAQIRTDLQAVMRAHTPESKKQAAEALHEKLKQEFRDEIPYEFDPKARSAAGQGIEIKPGKSGLIVKFAHGEKKIPHSATHARQQTRAKAGQRATAARQTWFWGKQGGGASAHRTGGEDETARQPDVRGAAADAGIPQQKQDARKHPPTAQQLLKRLVSSAEAQPAPAASTLGAAAATRGGVRTRAEKARAIKDFFLKAERKVKTERTLAQRSIVQAKKRIDAMLTDEEQKVDTTAAAEDAHLIDLQWAALKMAEAPPGQHSAPGHTRGERGGRMQAGDVAGAQSLAGAMAETSGPTWGVKRRAAVERLEEGAVRALTRASAAAIGREQAITEVGKGVSGVAKREQMHAALMDAYHALAL